MIYMKLAPVKEGITMNSSFLIASVNALIILAYLGQLVIAMAKAILFNDTPDAERMAIVRIKLGKERNTSVIRMSISSIRPLLYPAIVPIRIPISIDKATPPNAAGTELLPPHITLERRSLPKWSVPKGFSLLGRASLFFKFCSQ
ncbi:MAG: hypothetical protein PWQ16_4 [bacterium]|nr:hypothetical protein [bacterium]